MSSFLDSNASFRERALVIGISATHLDGAAAVGVTTMAKLAFASNYAPNGADDAPLLALIRTFGALPPPLVTPEPTAGEKSMWRRLHFEAHALCLAEIRQRVETPSETTARAMPLAERLERQEAQRLRLQGLDISGDYEPSHGLIDIVQAMFDSNSVGLVKLELCTRRQDEIHGHKKVQDLVIDEQGVRLQQSRPDLRVDLHAGSELDYMFAFIRRALAFDSCDLIGFVVHRRYIDRLFGEPRKPAVQGYSRTSISQLIEADRTLWTLLAENTRTGIRPAADGTKPLEVAFIALQSHAAVSFCLLPRPVGGAPKRGRASRTPSPVKKKRGSSKSPEKVAKKEKKNKNKKDKRDKKEKDSHLPRDLIGLQAKDKNGKSFCFNFNLGKCSDALSGNSCRRGVHVCMKCGDVSHGAKACTKSSSSTGVYQ